MKIDEKLGVEMFNRYLEITADDENRRISPKRPKAFKYDENEWYAFGFGWNAALSAMKHFQSDYMEMEYIEGNTIPGYEVKF